MKIGLTVTFLRELNKIVNEEELEYGIS